MKILCWNARGLGNPRAFRVVSDLIQVRRLHVLFISETKCGDNCTNKIKRVGNFFGCLSVNSVGRKGGLCLLWTDEVNLEVLSYSQNHINTKIEWENKSMATLRVTRKFKHEIY